MTTNNSLTLEVTVAATIDAAWTAIGTADGISSWYVPHTLEPKPGGAATASFGPGPEMTIPGRVAIYEPPRRIVFDGGEGVDGLSFEWTVQTNSDGDTTVRLVNAGFGDGPEAEAQKAAMAVGWGLFMRNLQLHLEHFNGQVANSSLPSVQLPCGNVQGWELLANQLGLAPQAEPGDEARAQIGADITLAGSVVESTETSVTLLLSSPAPGTAFIASEGDDDFAMVSVWAYLYGPDAQAHADQLLTASTSELNALSATFTSDDT